VREEGGCHHSLLRRKWLLAGMCGGIIGQHEMANEDINVKAKRLMVFNGIIG